MRATVVPIYFKRDKTDKFSSQLENIREELGDIVELLPAVGLGDAIDSRADAVVFPEILGEAYELSSEFQKIEKPIIILTSEFMTISMWDWEIINYLEGKGVSVLAPYNKEQSSVIFRSLALRREMQATSFLIFQDNPGEGHQPEIFKCFYWWTQECTNLIKDKFGVTIERGSLAALGEVERSFSDEEALAEVATWSFPVNEELTAEMKIGAAKYYLALKRALEGKDKIKGVGANCLNESRYSSSTPCIAWNLLFEREGLLWACEGDTLTLITKHILYHALKEPLMMTNIYPVLMGMAALKHEGIPAFPELIEPAENHLLLAHCGYFGLAPQSFCSSWQARPPVLKIVDQNAHALDVRFPVGPITLVKIDATLEKIMVAEGHLRGYVQYPGSDCRNGAIVEVADGANFMRKVYSHHQIVLTGHQKANIELIAKVFNLELENL